MTTAFKRLVRVVAGPGDLAAVLRGAGFVMLIRTLSVGLLYLTQVIVARWIGKVEYGIFSFAWAWVVVLSIPAELGLSTGSLRFIPQYQASGDRARLAGFLILTTRIVLAVGVALSLIGLVFVTSVRELIPAVYVLPLCVAFCAVPAHALLSLQLEKSRAFGWVGLAYIPKSLGFPVALLVGVGAMMLIGREVRATEALAAACLAALVVLLGQSAALRSRTSRLLGDVRPESEIRRWLEVSLPLLLVAGFQTTLNHTDVIMLGSLRHAADVAVYNAALKSAALISFVLVAVAALAAPRIARLHAEDRHQDLQGLVSGIVRWVFWSSLVVAAAILLLGRHLLGLFGAGFVSGYPILCILASGQIVNASVGPVAYLLNMTGHQTACARVFGWSALVNVALNGLLIPAWGGEGAAIATATTMMMWNIWLYYLVKKRLGIRSVILARRD